MRTTLTIKGLDKVQKRFAEIADSVKGSVGGALRAEAEIEMTEAKKRTPVDTGALRGSGHVEGPFEDTVVRRSSTRDAGGRFQKASARSFGGAAVVSVRMAFGGPAAPYAIKVHEDMEAFHRSGQAKYLESVLVESAPYLAERVAKRLKLTERGLISDRGSATQPRDSRGRFTNWGS